VKAVHGETELADRPDHDLGGDGGPVRVEEEVQGPREPVIVEKSSLPGSEAQEVGPVGSGPGGEAIERLPGEEEVPQEDPQADRGSLVAAPGSREPVPQDLLDTKPTEEVVEDGETPEKAGTMLEILQLGTGREGRASS
jgi:hypothetical protein